MSANVWLHPAVQPGWASSLPCNTQANQQLHQTVYTLSRFVSMQGVRWLAAILCCSWNLQDSVSLCKCYFSKQESKHSQELYIIYAHVQYSHTLVCSLIPRLLYVGGEKKSLVHTVCACSALLGICKICSITLTSIRHANFSCMKDACHWPCSLWTTTKERQRHSALHSQKLSIPAKQCSTLPTH